VLSVGVGLLCPFCASKNSMGSFATCLRFKSPVLGRIPHWELFFFLIYIILRVSDLSKSFTSVITAINILVSYMQEIVIAIISE